MGTIRDWLVGDPASEAYVGLVSDWRAVVSLTAPARLSVKVFGNSSSRQFVAGRTTGFRPGRECDDMSDTVGELVAYCHTQARLLHGHVERLDEETAALLSELDEELATVRAQLSDHGAGSHSTTPPNPDATDTADELADLEARESALAEKQAVVEAKQTRRDAFEALAAAYLELAETLRDESAPTSASVQRVLEFERDRDAPAYFEDRETLLEAADSAD